MEMNWWQSTWGIWVAEVSTAAKKGNSRRWCVPRAYSVPVSVLRSFKILTTLDDRDHYHPHFTEKHWDAGDEVNRPRRSTQFTTEQGCKPGPSGSLASLLTSLLCHSSKTMIRNQHICKCVCWVSFTHFITSLSSMHLFCDIRIKGSNKRKKKKKKKNQKIQPKNPVSGYCEDAM